MIISHDRWFLDRIVTHILPLRAIVEPSSSRATILSMKRIERSEWVARRRRPECDTSAWHNIQERSLKRRPTNGLKRCRLLRLTPLHPILNQLHGIAQVLNGVNAHLADLLFWQIGFRH